ncbi:kinase-like domain-containing protein [Flammula alnicola]|nr:kinase-like domain-containing protein [Flammula alnicola]
MAPILRLSDGEMVGCLKFVKDGGKAKEVEILQYLVGLDVESNHTVRPMRIWAITGGWIIAMPAAGNRLTQLIDLDTHLWSLMKQLFEAVKFMHDHNVAHLDLKPSNILIPSEYGRLTIIDFGVSVRLRNAAQLLQGRAGTEGYIAPEVDGRTKFSPIRADLWSTGKIVQELCMLCRPSRSRGDLLALSKQLLDDDPDKRPMMSEALQWMLNHDVITAANSVPTI